MTGNPALFGCVITGVPAVVAEGRRFARLMKNPR
jgi:hypothetical protein